MEWRDVVRSFCVPLKPICQLSDVLVVMVGINLAERLHGHVQIDRGVDHLFASLSHPRGACVPQRVRCDIGKAGSLAG